LKKFTRKKVTKKSGLSTFGGVFTPSILTILGVIMYLRLGWVIGNVGVIGTLIIITIATSITFLTSLSIASIATDQKVKIGGAYYMISRSLGIESGGAIGIPLFFAQALSVALYTVGFAESVAQVFPSLNQTTIAITTSIFVAAVALGSAKTAIRVQYIIMIGIVLSLLSLFFGSAIEPSEVEDLATTPINKAPFWIVFAVFFPAVTGIMAGVGMSGDLKNPQKSIPIGTIAAVLVSYVIYMILPFIMAGRADVTSLIEDPLIMRRMAFWGDAILIGVWGATLSSAVGSILGAPRVLQALAKDGILPKFFSWLGKSSGKDDSPRAGTLFTLGIVLIAVWMGDLNLIAPVLSMFFLTTYAVLNIAAGTERFLGSPSFRPKFKVHWLFSFLGAIGCISVMFLINTGATIIALVFVVMIFIWLKGRELHSVWGDISRGIRMMLIKSSIMKLTEDHDPKNWRPNPMVLAGSPTKRWYLIEFANTITQGKGILTVASILPANSKSQDQILRMKKNIQNFLRKKGVNSLVKILPAKTPFEGVSHLAEAYGLGPLHPNTFILGTTASDESMKAYSETIKQLYDLKRNVLIVHKGNERPTFGDKKRIDVWWGGLKGNGGLMIILAYLTNNHIDWRLAKVHIKMVVADEAAKEASYENMLATIDEIRINATIDIIAAEGRSFETILHEQSKNADLIFMGMATPNDDFDTYFEKIQKRIENLPTTVLALAAQEIAFNDVLIQKDSMQKN